MSRPSIPDLLHELRTLEESARIEAKLGFGKSALESIVAFSNEPGLGGGFLLFGVAEDSDAPGGYRVAGVDKPSQLSENIASECRAKLSFPVRPQIWPEEVQGACVVAAFVPEAANHDKPVYITARGVEHGCYRRIGSADVKCRPEDLTEMYAGRLGHSAEQVAVAGSSLADVDARALSLYRQRLAELRPGNETAELPDAQLLLRLGASTQAGELTRAGLVLFGTEAALRQFLPAVRIDLVQVEGTAWAQSAEQPFLEQLELRQHAVGAFRRAQDWLGQTLPKTSRFEPGDPERKDDTTVPSRVLREALVNAIIHRDYAVNEPILVVRYQDRVEIRGPGYSLVNREEWGQSGSRTRNQSIAEVFRDLNLAETKGTGIQMMRRRMLQAERRPPEFRSDRKANRFTSVLSLEHLLGDDDRRWLELMGAGQLDLPARQALLVARDEGRIANADLRDRTGLDTLAASEVLKRLRGLGLLRQRSEGGKAQAYYVLAGRSGPQMGFDEGVIGGLAEGLSADEADPDAGELGPDAGELAPDAGELGPDAGESRVQLEAFDAATQRAVGALGTRPRRGKLRQAILALCSERPLRPNTLAALLGNRSVKHLVADHLGPMVSEGLLERTGQSATDPRQAYRAVTSKGSDDAQGS